MANFKAYLHAMTVGISNKHAVNMKIVTRTLQTHCNGKFGTKKIKKTASFKTKPFFRILFLIIRPIVFYMVGKLGM